MKFELMPSVFPEQTMWGATAGGFSFVISRDDSGYTASYRSQFGGKMTSLGGYAAFQSFDRAEQACRDAARDLIANG